MTECQKYRNLLTDLHYGEIKDRMRERLLKHLESCADCRRELYRIREFSEKMNSLSVEALDESGINRVLERTRRSRPWLRRMFDILRFNLEPVEQMFLPGLLGASACLLTLAPVLSAGGYKHVQPVTLLICGILYSSVYNSIISALFQESGNEEHQQIHLRIVLYGVLSGLLFMHFFYYIGLRAGLMPSMLVEVFTLKLPGSLAVCSAMALLMVGLGIGITVDRRSLPHMLLILTLYLCINLPGLSVFTQSPFNPVSLFNLALPMTLCGLAGLVIGRALKGSFPGFSLRQVPGAAG